MVSRISGLALTAALATWTMAVPLVFEDQKIVPEDIPGVGWFGTSMDTSSDLCVVGASTAVIDGVQAAGSAFIYDLSTGERLQVLSSHPPLFDALFGYDVAISGQFALVGAAAEDVAGVERAGAAYVFDWATGQQLHRFISPDTREYGYFGQRVLIVDDWALIVEQEDADNVSETGSIYVFSISTGELIQTIIAPDLLTGQADSTAFGTSLAISGRKLLIGAPFSISGLPPSAGCVYVLDLDTGDFLGKIEPPDGEPRDLFGFQIAANGSTVLIGAPNANTVSADNAGAAYVADLDSLQVLHRLESPTPRRYAYFGDDVAITDQHYLVAGYRSLRAGVPDSGAVDVFDRESLAPIGQLGPSDAPASSDPLFGDAIAVSNEFAIAGWTLDGASPLEFPPGAIYVYRISTIPDCTVDFAAPFGVLDLADIVAFVGSFAAGEPMADLDGSGVFDLVDLNCFIAIFVGGC